MHCKMETFIFPIQLYLVLGIGKDKVFCLSEFRVGIICCYVEITSELSGLKQSTFVISHSFLSVCFFNFYLFIFGCIGSLLQHAGPPQLQRARPLFTAVRRPLIVAAPLCCSAQDPGARAQ